MQLLGLLLKGGMLLNILHAAKKIKSSLRAPTRNLLIGYYTRHTHQHTAFFRFSSSAPLESQVACIRPKIEFVLFSFAAVPVYLAIHFVLFA